MRTIVFGTFGPLNTANPCYITLLPTILALRDIWVYVGFPHHCNDISYIESSIDDFLALEPLWVSYISIQTIVMLDLGETLIIHSLEARTMSLKM